MKIIKMDLNVDLNAASALTELKEYVKDAASDIDLDNKDIERLLLSAYRKGLHDQSIALKETLEKLGFSVILT